MNATPSRPTIGLIPCYLKLYDDIRPETRLGGTHHSALTLGGHAEAIAAFGRLCGLDTTVLAPGA